MTRDTKRWIFDIGVWTATIVSVFILLASAEAAPHKPSPANAQWQSECGSCHVPYPPQLLPATSWRTLMDGLERHFGTNASLDPESLATISAFLETYAGHGPKASSSDPAPRITETRWFTREHAEVPSAIWARPNLKRSDCAACHREAANGDFGERTLRLPN